MGTIVQNSLVYKRPVGSKFCFGSYGKLSLPAEMANTFYCLCRRLVRFVLVPENNFKKAVVQNWAREHFLQLNAKRVPFTFSSASGEYGLYLHFKDLHLQGTQKECKLFPEFQSIFYYLKLSFLFLSKGQIVPNILIFSNMCKHLREGIGEVGGLLK